MNWNREDSREWASERTERNERKRIIFKINDDAEFNLGSR